MVLVAACGGAEGAAYNYTFIAPTGNSSSVGVNSNGSITWRTIESDTFIHRYDGGTDTTIATGSLPGGVSVPSINDAAHVAFRFGNGSVEGIRLNDGSGNATMVDTTGPLSAFGNPSLNNSDKVAVWASADIGGSGIFTVSGSITSPIVQSGGIYSGFAAEPVINQSGQVVFKASLTSGGQGVFRSDGVSTTTIATTSGSATIGGFNMNDAGTVIYSSAGKIWTGNGTGAPTPVVSIGTSTFSSFGNLEINAYGKIAFHGVRPSGIEGIFTGPDPLADKVIQTGDSLFGGTVNSIRFFTEGLNNSGAIAFYAQIGGPTSETGGAGDVIVLATPVPEPALGVVMVGVGMVVGRRRGR